MGIGVFTVSLDLSVHKYARILLIPTTHTCTHRPSTARSIRKPRYYEASVVAK